MPAAPVAFKQAQVSVSLRGATTVAIDTAQIILMDQTLHHLPTLFALAEEFEANMDANLITTVVPGVVIIVGAFAGLIGYSAAIMIFTMGLAAGVINAMAPCFHAAFLNAAGAQETAAS